MRPKTKVKLPHRTGLHSFALVATLALVVVATLLLVLFVTVSSLDRTASHSYSQSLRAEQIGQGGLRLVVGQLQAEMSKDGLPDTGGGAYPTATIFTNVTSANIAPQAMVTNAALPTLVKMSTNNLPFYSGTVSSGGLQATAISSATPSLNGRSVSTTAWNQAFFGQFPNAASTPYWVLMTRGGPTNAANIPFGATGNSVNNSASANTNYVLGRIAYAVYDESGLLDINAAGCPSGLTPAQLAQIKGTLAGADLTQVGFSPSQAATFVQWRNATSAASANSYLSYVTNFAATNGFLQVAQGDTTFLSRQDLIKAANSPNTGLPTSALTNLTTFTRELNIPSWGPSLTGGSYGTLATQYRYAANANNLTNSPFGTKTTTTKSPNPNPFIPIVRYVKSGTVTAYRSDGTSYTYTVSAGDPVVQQRFPLDRLSWIGPSGPNIPGMTAAQAAPAIRACFGLVWGKAEDVSSDSTFTTSGTPSGTGLNVWKYYGSSLSPVASVELSATLVNPVATLSDVAQETTPRAPNFFELLQAGVLSGSLGIKVGSPTLFAGMTSSAQNITPLQLFRMGANMISQVQTQAYPVNIQFNAQGDSLVATGASNLPYINALNFVGGISPDDADQTNPSNNGSHKVAIYTLIGLWNPHQRSTPDVSRPPVRLYIQGEIDAATAWATAAGNVPVVAGGNGCKTLLTANSRWIQLASSNSAGSGGFQNPYGITSSDVAATDGSTGSTASAGWAPTPASMVASTDIDNGITYEAFRLPDIAVNFNVTGAAVPSGGPANGLTKLPVYLGGPTNPPSNPFELILKYQDASGNWIPYDYFFGINTNDSWLPSFSTFATQFPVTVLGSGAGASVMKPYSVPTLHTTLHPTDTTVHGSVFLNADPRCLFFGPFRLISDGPGPGQPNAGYGLVNDTMVDSIWSGYNTLHSAQVLSPFDLSGYGGASSTGAGSVPGEFNAIMGFMGNYFFPAYLPRNNTAYPNVPGGSAGSWFTAYLDTDGIQRIGDSGLFPTTGSGSFAGSTGNPYYDPNDLPNTPAPRTSDRPIILNRPFASVGELGYVFRDHPWRSLDFFSVFNGLSTSGDSGLLDLFTVTDSANAVVAGRVNLNTKNGPVLQAVLNNTLADPVGGSQTLSSTAATAIPPLLTTFTQTTPLVNKDQLVTKFNPTLTASAFSNTDEQSVKAYREAYIRSLADVGQTRTWNLMIDLVAQSGKYPPTATSLDQFEVDGERHYWLHVAIDRFTGKIIDRQLELIDQ